MPSVPMRGLPRASGTSTSGSPSLESRQIASSPRIYTIGGSEREDISSLPQESKDIGSFRFKSFDLVSLLAKFKFLHLISEIRRHRDGSEPWQVPTLMQTLKIESRYCCGKQGGSRMGRPSDAKKSIPGVCKVNLRKGQVFRVHVM